LIEAGSKLTDKKLFIQLEKSYGITKEKINSISFLIETSQRLSHQFIHFSFYQVECNVKPLLDSFIWIKNKDIAAYPFPKTLAHIAQTNLH
jgi:hypothetical protein